MPRAGSEVKYTLKLLADDMTEVLDSLTAGEHLSEVFDNRAGLW
jgi:hypothetical protein